MRPSAMRLLLAFTLTTLAPGAAAVKLELPAFLNTLQAQRNADLQGEQSRLWWNILMLAAQKAGSPSVLDVPNAYARWGERTAAFNEVAVWRTTTGRAIVGINSVQPPLDNCGDYPCGPRVEFIGFDGKKYVEAPDSALDMEFTCGPRLGISKELRTPALDQAIQAGQARLQTYAKYLRVRPGAAHTMCVFPRQGTTVTLAVLNSDLKPGYRGRILPLYSFRFDRVRGTFTPSSAIQ